MSAQWSVVVLFLDLSLGSIAGAVEPLPADVQRRWFPPDRPATVSPAGGLPGVSPSEPARIGPVAVQLAWIDPAGLAESCGQAARREAARILVSVGLTVAWRVADPSEQASERELRVILLDRIARIGRAAILGATPPKSVGAPALWVHVPSIRAVLRVPGRGPLGDLDVRGRYLMGRAVGRVIAHEVIHAVAPDVPHGQGLMAPSFGRRDLMDSNVRIEPDVAEAVRAALAAGRPLSPRPDTAILASE